MKKKNFKKASFIFALSLALLLVFTGTNTYAATVGEQLTSPEEGWTRYDDTESNIIYKGDGWRRSNIGSFYKTYETVVSDATNKEIEINFTGTKIRLITTMSEYKTRNYKLFLDGVEYPYTQYSTQSKHQAISFEKTDLANGKHTLTIKGLGTGQFGLDAVDIDEDGELLSPDTPIPPTDPTEPEEPTTPEQPSGNRAILVVTMTTGLEKEFDLSMKEVNDFIDWYEAKQAGSGKASYAIDKHDNNKGPFSSRKDYILYDRVLTFEVSEYN
ncbi:hypothetical protein J1TS5_03960 [Paenibacillus macerans]|uniref:bacterial surface protein n=1 Tax=Paenibacillus macerans TaxID=44252 RepID=UPI001B04B918|nr:bacterial surface protein [Paenibacillus macerans]GIP08226.1 hypothetical protein J1TS5_03960 [Paenibacillus macerans]